MLNTASGLVLLRSSFIRQKWLILVEYKWTRAKYYERIYKRSLPVPFLKEEIKLNFIKL